MTKLLVTMGIVGAAALFLQSHAACTLTLTKYSPTAKAAYIGSQSISDKVQQALSGQCSISLRMATFDEQVQFERAKYEAKIKRMKLRAGK